MPTPSKATVEVARALVLARLGRAGPGNAVAYADVVRGVEAACPALTPRRARHALRAAVDALADAGQVELWGRRLRDGRWVVTSLRAPGRAEPPPAPRPRQRWRPAKPYKGRFHVAPELLAVVERTVLDLLADPPGEGDNLLASNFSPPPGPGWVYYGWLTSRTSFALQGRLNPATRLNVLGVATRSLARQGKVSLRGRRQRNGKVRLRWCRLEAGRPQPKPPKRERVRLAEEHGPPLEVEATIDRRLDELFVGAVERHYGRPLSAAERADLLERTRRRVPAVVEGNRDGGGGKEDLVVPRGLYDDLGPAGVLTADEMRDLEVEQRVRLDGHVHGYGPSLPPDGPTDAEPGSEAKIRVMRRRYLRRQALHHPDDRKLSDGIIAAGLLARAAAGRENDHGDD